MLRLLKFFESRVLILAAVVIAGLWAFITFADEVMEGDTADLDRHILLLVRTPGDTANPIGSRSVEEAMRDVTALGGFTLLTLITLVAVLAFLFHRKRLHAAIMLGAVLMSEVITDLAKHAYGRPRPDLVSHGSYVYSASFPSGHSTQSAVVYLTLAMLISSLETRRSTKALAWGIAILTVLFVGFSRIYLGVHWPTDVVGGWTLGTAIVLCAWAVLLQAGGRPKP